MDDVNQPTDKEGLILRVKAILLQPKAEWEQIDGEQTSIGDIYKSYILILAAIGPVCTLIHSVLFGYSFLGITYKPGVLGSISTAIVSYLLGLLLVYVLAWIIDLLAPSFGGVANRHQAFKVAAYSSTAAWVAGIFNLLPGLGLLTLLGLYSLYLLYLGLPRLMKAPEDKALGYTAVTIVLAVILFIIGTTVAGAVTSRFAGDPMDSLEGSSVTIPGGGSIDLGKLEQLGKQAEAAAAGKAAQVDPEQLKALLPASIAGLARGEVSSASVGGAGIGGSQVEAKYGADGNRVSLQVIDMSALGAVAGLGAAFGVESSKEDADSYERVGKIDGRMTMEKWNKTSKNGSYGVMIADRFMVQADGTAESIDVLKQAVASVDADALEDLAQQ
jgi:hypothetical protein